MALKVRFGGIPELRIAQDERHTRVGAGIGQRCVTKVMNLAKDFGQPLAHVHRKRKANPQRSDRMTRQGVGLRVQIDDLGAAELSGQDDGRQDRGKAHAELRRASRYDEFHRPEQTLELGHTIDAGLEIRRGRQCEENRDRRTARHAQPQKTRDVLLPRQVHNRIPEAQILVGSHEKGPVIAIGRNDPCVGQNLGPLDTQNPSDRAGKSGGCVVRGSLLRLHACDLSHETSHRRNDARNPATGYERSAFLKPSSLTIASQLLNNEDCLSPTDQAAHLNCAFVITP